MTFGALLGGLTLYTTLSAPVSQFQLLTAATYGGLYYVAGISALAYPDAKGMDPEFGEGNPQVYFFAGVLATNVLG